MEAITSNDNNTNSKVPKQELTNEKNLFKLFEQYSDFTQALSVCLEVATAVVISKASVHNTYHVIAQKQPTIALLDTGANISVISQFCFPQKRKLVKLHMHKIMLASGASLGLIGYCHPTF